MTYIPDLTERFPEGYGGVDMTPSFFGEPVDWSRALKEDYDYDESSTETSPKRFEVGDEYEVVGIYGGVTYYTVEKIDRENKRIFLSETWRDIDGSGTRSSSWHELEEDENGNEKCLDWESKTYGEFWIYAKES